MRLIIIFLFLNCAGATQAQFNGNRWCFGDSSGIDFNSTIPTTFQSGIDTRGSCSTICDSNGTLLFYAVCGNWPVWSQGVLYAGLIKNKQHQTMDNGSNLIGENWYRETIIIPKPDSANLFYVFTAGVTIYNGLFYSVIDLNKNGGLGKVVSKNNQLLNLDACDGLTAIKHGNGRDWWVFFRRWDIQNKVFYRFLVSPLGISTVMTQQIGSNQQNGFAKLIFNHLGTKAITTTAGGLLEVFDFDRCTGMLSNATTIHTETNTPKFAFWFATFSPNDSLLYVSTGNSTEYLYQFKMYANNIWNSRTVIDSFSTITYAGGDLKLAPDGKIYHARAYYDGLNFNYPYPDTVYNMYNTYLSVINNPDSPGVACNFTPYSFYLGGNRTYWGLPNNPDYNLQRIAGSPCDTVLWTGIAPEPTINGEGDLKVYYNADWQILFVNAQNLKGKNVALKIYDLNGRVVYDVSRNNPSGYFTHDINCNAFASGMYVVRLLTEKENLVCKFIRN